VRIFGDFESVFFEQQIKEFAFVIHSQKLKVKN
jgi:hypothetical protein